MKHEPWLEKWSYEDDKVILEYEDGATLRVTRVDFIRAFGVIIGLTKKRKKGMGSKTKEAIAMATILEQYRKRQNEIREQIAANSLPLDQMLIMQELNYRICVLETFESLCKSAPVTMDTKAMGFHFQLVDAYVRFTLNERKFGPKTDAEGQKKRETALQSFTQVAQDGRKRFSSFSASTQEQYKTCINNYIKTILPVWMQYRNTYINF